MNLEHLPTHLIAHRDGNDCRFLVANGLACAVDTLESTDEPTGVFEVVSPDSDASDTRDVSEDVAVFWWAQIASDVALGKRVLPSFIRARLDDAALFAALDPVETVRFSDILHANGCEEIEAASGRVRERG